MSSQTEQTIWTPEKCVALAKLLEQRPCLWSRNHDDYKKKIVKHDALSSIARELNVPQIEVDAKIKIITGQFQRELKKEMHAKSRSGSNETYKSKWFLFDFLKFLNDTVKIRTTIDSGTPVENLMIEEQEVNTNEIDISQDIDEEEQLLNDQIFDVKDDEFCKTYKKRKAEDAALSSAVMTLVKSLSNPESVVPTLSTSSAKQTEDEWDLFGALVAKKIRSLQNPVSQIQAENEINQILFKKRIEEQGYIVMPDVSANT